MLRGVPGTLSRRGHYGLSVPLGIPCVAVQGGLFVFSELLSWGLLSVLRRLGLPKMSPQGSSPHGGVSGSFWGLVVSGRSCP